MAIKSKLASFEKAFKIKHQDFTLASGLASGFLVLEIF